MEDIKLIEEEFERQRKLPKEVKKKISFNIFKNLLAAAIIMIYFLIINITYYRANSNFEDYIKYYACIVAVISVVFFELAYNKKKLFFTIIGIEFLSCGVLSIFIPYIYLHTTSKLRLIVMILPALLIIYYAIKSLIILKKGKIDYTNSISDIKEILRNDKISYLEENNGKVYRNKLKEEEEIKESIKKEQEVRKRKKKKN